MVKIKKKRVSKKANSLIKFLVAFSFILVLPFCFNFKSDFISKNVASAEYLAPVNSSSYGSLSIEYPVSKKVLKLGSLSGDTSYDLYSNNRISVASLSNYISDYNSSYDYVFYKYYLSLYLIVDGVTQSFGGSHFVNKAGVTSSELYYSNNNIFIGSLDFSSDYNDLRFDFGFNSNYTFSSVARISIYYFISGNNSPSQEDYDNYINANNYHSNEDYLNYGDIKYNEGREFEKTQLGLEDCSDAISSCNALYSGTYASEYENNSKPRTVLSSKNVNSNYNHVAYYYWNGDVKLNDIKNQNFINIDSGVYPIKTGSDFDLKQFLYSGLAYDALGNDIASSLRLVFEYGFKGSTNEFLFSFIIDNTSWDNDIVSKVVPRLNNLCFKLSDDAGNSQIIYGYNAFELYSNYLNNLSSPSSDNYYDLGFNDGVNSVDQEADNAQAINDYIEHNNYHSNDDYLNYGKEQYNNGFVKSENGKDTLSKLVFSIIDAPFNVLSNAFNFDIFGVNLSAFLIALVSLILIGFVIRRLL